MGVPKFFRYISERYPCLSEIIKEYQIPEFDHLYLDMNGIIHMCSHPDDGDPHFRITEEKIFQDIFHYIEVLFRMIKPRKLFFMAVDGVAPRAKMNQQRGRRFRSAKDALILENRARERGEELPTEDRFDSNCITPGTVFMVRLHEQLKYFVVNKISTDKLWQNCKIILSGHETPGEGEHKIMDYIRYMRAQPGYDPNTRHCLYGLDADLIMLGLCTHEPHFSLLREEVRFGKKSNKRKNIPEQINFYLLHLSLMREYLELEFYPLKESLSFEYDMEKIIDDWVLMGFLVGNDFIPHLPNMHIGEGALPILYDAYMKVLPKLGGYINEAGTLNLKRFELFISQLASLDMDIFTEKYTDLKWFEAKTGRRFNEGILEEWKSEDDDIIFEPLETNTRNSELSSLVEGTAALLKDTNNKENSESSNAEGDLFTVEFVQHKTDYYRNKLEFANVTPELLQSQAEEYVRAIQWNLHYYYNGVCSWSWYYPHHYAPYISDIKGFSNLVLTFDLAEPFKPYEQLLAVLPSASKLLLPIPFQELMVNEDSLIKDFYPEDFKTDLNGKKQEWEAVVLIPFIDEKILLKAMAQCCHRLTPEEVNRNCHGPMLVYQFTSKNLGSYAAPEYFPPLDESHALCKPILIADICVPKDKLVKGAYPGAKFDVYYPGFPTLKHLKYEGTLEKWKVRVFDQPSRGDNMILHVIKEEDDLPTTDAIANEILGKSVHVGWPHLIEALVISISTKEYRYQSAGAEGQYNVEENRGKDAEVWNMECQSITEHYRDRLGIDAGDIEVLVKVKVMVGRKYTFTQHGKISFEKQWSIATSVYPIQTIVHDIDVYEENFTIYKDIASAFPVGSTCFMLGQPGYGLLGEVMQGKEALENGRIKLSFKGTEEPDLSPLVKMDNNIRVHFMNLHTASTKLSISRGLFSRITGSVFVSPGHRSTVPSADNPKINIGLNLKFNKKNEEIPGYSRKEGNTWLYSEKAIALVSDYLNRFPKVTQFLNSNVGDDIFYEADVFPEGNSKEMLSNITTWIKQQPFYSIDRLVCGSLVVDPEAVRALESLIDNFQVQNRNLKPKVMQVKPHLLYKPGLQMGNLMPDPSAQFQLFDRVVNIRESYSVPLGLKGTIIGIHNASSGNDEEITYDVLFDTPFAGGLAVNNCSPNRAYRMSKPAILNISYGKREYQGRVNKNTPNHKVPTQSNYGAPQYPVTNQLNIPQSYPWPPGGGMQFPPGGGMQFPPGSGMQLPPGGGIQLPPPNFNPYFNYHAPPPPPQYMNQGPNTFVPYKGNHFPLGPPPHLLPTPMNFYQPPPLMQSNMPTFNPRIVPANGNIPYQKPIGLMDKVFHKPPEQPSPGNDSEYLKRILKIEENNSKASSNNNSITLTKSDSLSYYTVQLLKEFQIRNLGCPNYQHFDMNNKFTAKIMMPDGSYVFGEPARSKDHASENAAKEALNILCKNKISTVRANEMSPASVTNNANINNSPVRPKPDKRAIQATIFKHLEISSPTVSIAKSFEPLQAMHNQSYVTNSHNISNTVLDSNVPKESMLQEPLQPMVTKNEVSPNAVNPIKRRERKMRLAANFQTSMK